MKHLITQLQILEHSQSFKPLVPSQYMINLSKEANDPDFQTALQNPGTIQLSFLTSQVLSNFYDYLKFGKCCLHHQVLYLLQNYMNVFDINIQSLQEVFFSTKDYMVKRNILFLLTSQQIDQSEFIQEVLESFLHSSQIYYILTPLCVLLKAQNELFDSKLHIQLLQEDINFQTDDAQNILDFYEVVQHCEEKFPSCTVLLQILIQQVELDEVEVEFLIKNIFYTEVQEKVLELCENIEFLEQHIELHSEIYSNRLNMQKFGFKVMLMLLQHRIIENLYDERVCQLYVMKTINQEEIEEYYRICKT